MYPGIPSMASFTPKKVKPVHFTEDQERTATDPEMGPAANISEYPSEYRVNLAVPGLKREDFYVELNQGVISISAKKSEEVTGCINDRCEFDYHYWTRAFILPDDADAILTQATYKDGELVIHIPRDKKAESKALVTVTVY